MARLAHAEIATGAPERSGLARTVAAGIEIHLDVAGGADVAAERARLTKDADGLERYVQTVDAKLADPEFTDKAPKQVVEKERAKRAAAAAELEKLRAQIASLG
jgi:valyl-tRNA synthetase